MARTYATPLAFKAAVEQRLRNEAVESGLDLRRLRQLLVFDRYLARVFAVLKDAVVLKGGLVVELRLARARTTRDIDLRLVGSPDGVLPRLQEAGRLDLGDYLTFEVQRDPNYPAIDAEGMTYQGLRHRAQGYLAGKVYGAPFGIDVPFAEPLEGLPDVVAGSDFLVFAGVAPAAFRIYPLETHVAEKLHAYTLPRSRPNSRVKDLPDIALLASARVIDARVLRAAVDKTFSHRATHPVPARLPPPPPGWVPVYARMAAADGLPWRDLDSVTTAASSFLDPVLREAPGQRLHWMPERWTWVRDGGEGGV
jgi:Nucleotidyl transferase AbiEii toxin, Type IV TA system